jgi:hypothetical protein
MPPRHILVFGSTSPLGLDFAHAALRASHTLTLYIRNPSKLPGSITSSPLVTTVIGTLFDASALETAVYCGATTCISFLGPVLGNCRRGDMPLTKGYELIVPLLCKYEYKRVMITSTASYAVPQDRFSVLCWLMVWSVYLLFRGAYDEINGFTPLVTRLSDNEGVKWTVFRVPALTSGDARLVHAAYVSDVGVRVERKGVAKWVLKEMDEEKWIGKCPALANA